MYILSEDVENPTAEYYDLFFIQLKVHVVLIQTNIFQVIFLFFFSFSVSNMITLNSMSGNLRNFLLLMFVHPLQIFFPS